MLDGDSRCGFDDDDDDDNNIIHAQLRLPIKARYTRALF